jgi:hypothetical protein
MTTTGGAPMTCCFSYRGGKIDTWLSGGESGGGLDDLFIAADLFSRLDQILFCASLPCRKFVYLKSWSI